MLLYVHHPVVDAAPVGELRVADHPGHRQQGRKALLVPAPERPRELGSQGILWVPEERPLRALDLEQRLRSSPEVPDLPVGKERLRGG